MKLTIRHLAKVLITTFLLTGAGSILAALDPAATLDITRGEGGFSRPDSGSWFAMESLGPGEWVYTGLEGKDGIHLGSAQAASSSSPISAGIDKPWIFFGNTGLHQSNTPISVITDDGAGSVVLDFSGWGITWNNIDNIPMNKRPNAGDDGAQSNTEAKAVLSCAADCAEGDRYQLDYTATVPDGDPSNFGNVIYHLHLEGTISAPGSGGGGSSGSDSAPVTTDAHAGLAAGGTTQINLRNHISHPQGNESIDFSSLEFTNNCNGGEPFNRSQDGVITYVDIDGAHEDCDITYTVTDTSGEISNASTILVRVRIGNAPPVANNDSALTHTGQIANIAILENDTDGDGMLNPSTINVTAGFLSGTLQLSQTDGLVVYTPFELFAGTDRFSYTVSDDKGEISNSATVTIRVNEPPTAVEDQIFAPRNGKVEIPVLHNDRDDDGEIEFASVSPGNGSHGVTTVNSESGTITYTPDTGFIGTDRFTYTFRDREGGLSNIARVTVTVINARPLAPDIIVTLNVTRESSVDINILEKATDPDGSIDPASLVIVSPASQGVAVINPGSGVITYTPPAGYLGRDSFTYTITDNDGETSLPGTVKINVTDTSGAVLGEGAILLINPGPGGSQKPAAGAGSWFGMEALGPGAWIYIGVNGNDGIQLGKAQIATSAPVSPGIDNPWTFFGNTGLHTSTAPVNILGIDASGNVLLDFSGWGVTWNAIPVIPLNDKPHGGVDGGATLNDPGIAIMSCDADCSDGDNYVIEYTATVPDGDPSGFGNVHYHLHFEGQIASSAPTVGGGDASAEANVSDIALGDTAVLSAGGGGAGVNVSAKDIGVTDPLLNPKNGQQCIGECIDISATGIETGGALDLVYRLDDNIPEGAIYRGLINGKWKTFDITQGNQMGSADEQDGQCTGPEGVFDIGLKTGKRCVFLKIIDGGANDADGLANGSVKHLGGVALAGDANRPAGSTSGCSLGGDRINVWERSDWLLLFGFVIWLGLLAHRRRTLKK